VSRDHDEADRRVRLLHQGRLCGPKKGGAEMDHRRAIERVKVLLQGLQESDAENEGLWLSPCTCAADAEALETLLATVERVPVGCANERQGSCRGFSSREAAEKGAEG